RRNQELVAAAGAAAASASLGSETSMDSLMARLNHPAPPTREIARSTFSVEDERVAEEEFAAAEADVSETNAAKEIAGGIESAEDVHVPWTPIEETQPWTVPLETDAPVAGMK